MINGDWVGVCKITQAQDIYDNLKKKRRENIIDRHTSIVFDYTDKEIRCYFDGGRLLRPVLVVSNNKLNLTPEVVKDVNDEMKLGDKTKSWKKILSKHSNLENNTVSVKTTLINFYVGAPCLSHSVFYCFISLPLTVLFFVFMW